MKKHFVHVFVSAACFLLQGQAWALPVVDIESRLAVQQLYNNVYKASSGVEAQWTGNVANCDAGDTSDAYKNAILQRINYFRSMSGVGANIQFNAEFNRKARQAALMMSANNTLSHQPPQSWVCYSADGADAAGDSNLGLGTHGPEAITLLMEDQGGNNIQVGHRRWIYYPQTQEMGTGDIVPSLFSVRPAHASVVTDQNVFAQRPATRDGFVSWPPPGYVPFQLVFPRWSLSYADADFSNAVIEMTDSQGSPVNLSIIYRSNPPVPGRISAPAHSIVWEPSINPRNAEGRADVEYNVTISNVVLGGVVKTFEYTVTAFDASLTIDPQPPQSEPFIMGTTTVDHRWKSIEKPTSMNDPVMIVGVPSFNGAQPGVIQVNNEADVANISVRFREWNYLDKIHAAETVDYLLLEAGFYSLSDGTIIQVGSVPISGTQIWKTTQFQNSFPEIPHVFASLQTSRGGDTAATRIRNIGKESFEISLIEQQNLNGSGHIEENVGFIAIYHPQNAGVINFINSNNESPYALNRIQVSHQWSDIFGYSIKLEEEISFDPEVVHFFESVDVMMINNKLFGQITSMIGADPVVMRRR